MSKIEISIKVPDGRVFGLACQPDQAGRVFSELVAAINVKLAREADPNWRGGAASFWIEGTA